MIAHLKGLVTDKSHQALTIEIEGIGYAVAITDDRLYKKNDEVFLHIYTHWNQDTGPHLYGFDTLLSKKVFAQILSCSGCGPKIGLAVLSTMSASHFLQVIATGDARGLSDVPGVGPKKAELMIMQLKDKITKIAPEDIHPAKDAGFHKVKQVSAALTALHYKTSEVAIALDFLNKNVSLETSSFDELLKKALSVLAKRL